MLDGKEALASHEDFFFLDKTRKIENTKKGLTFPVGVSMLFNVTSTYP